MPRYAGLEPRVVVIDGNGFYAYDLVQNDPYLRDDLVIMVDVGEPETAAAIQRRFPRYRLVYRDQGGAVWSEVTPPALKKNPNGGIR